MHDKGIAIVPTDWLTGDVSVGEAIVLRTGTPRTYKGLRKGCMFLTFVFCAPPIIVVRNERIYHWEVAHLLHGIWDVKSISRTGREAAAAEEVRVDVCKCLPAE